MCDIVTTNALSTRQAIIWVYGYNRDQKQTSNYRSSMHQPQSNHGDLETGNQIKILYKPETRRFPYEIGLLQQVSGSPETEKSVKK